TEDELARLDRVGRNVYPRRQPVDGRLGDAVREAEVLLAVQIDDGVQPEHQCDTPNSEVRRQCRVALLERGLVAREQQQQHIHARRVWATPQPRFRRVFANVTQRSTTVWRDHAGGELV